MVVKYGGKPLGLSGQMPAYGYAYSDEQIREVVRFLKTLADTEGYPPGELNFLRPVRTIKPFPEKEALLITRFEDRAGGSTLRSTIYCANRFKKQFQYEIKASSTDTRPGEAEEEIELGLKWAFLAKPGSDLLMGTGLELELPLDDSARSQRGAEKVVPYLSVAKGIGNFTIQSTLRLELPADMPGDGAAEWSTAVHWMHSLWPRRAFPAIETIVGAPFGTGSELEVSVLPQVLVGLTRAAM